MKRTIYFNPATAAILDADNEPNLSAKVAHIFGAYAQACDAGQIPRDDPDALASALVRYRAILDEAAPALTENEWSLLCDALNGSVLTAGHADNADPDIACRLANYVFASAADGLGEKWGVDVTALAARIAPMPHAARCAIVETVARFWRQSGKSLDPIEQQLRAAGAKMASGEDIAA